MRGGSASDPRIGLHGVPAFLSGQQNIGRDAAFSVISWNSVHGVACRGYESCVEPVAETFGLSASSLSRRFKKASARKLQELRERDLSSHDMVAFGLPHWSP
ncbi:MAG: hypothetical protein HY287_18060 [Planctomycetes bacterium]|nr:hypothetical protein [Planctomycetota bacterium]MBI3836229.1 hypothetical protein [Planctomycetota bacterium]